MERFYFLYYEDKLNENYVMYSSKTKKITTMEYDEWMKIEKKYFMIKGFEPTHEGLLEYAKKFKEWVTELKAYKLYTGNKKQHWTLDVLFYDTLNTLSRQFFKRVCKGKFEHHQPKSRIEMGYIMDCANGGLQHCDESVRDEYVESYSYDWSFHYPNCMSSDKLMIPNKPGKEYKLKELPSPDKLKTGFYRVKITCENKDFRKLFAFSKKNTYSDRSVYQAMKHAEEFDVKLELNQKLKYNAYLYDDKDLERGSLIFNKWFDKISELKKAFPKNGIVKFMGSSLCMQLESKHEIYRTEDQVASEKLDIGVNSTHRYIVNSYKIYCYPNGDEKKRVYCLTDLDHPQLFNIRLKTFLTAYARNKCARLVTGNIFFGKDSKKNVKHDLKDVIAIHTDRVTFRKPMKHLEQIQDLKAEEKSTGLIKWFHAGKYHNKTTGKFHGRF